VIEKLRLYVIHICNSMPLQASLLCEL